MPEVGVVAIKKSLKPLSVGRKLNWSAVRRRNWDWSGFPDAGAVSLPSSDSLLLSFCLFLRPRRETGFVAACNRDQRFAAALPRPQSLRLRFNLFARAALCWHWQRSVW